MRDSKIRLYDNNHLEDATITAPADVSFPFANSLDGLRRNLVWKPASLSFTIQADLGYNANVSLFAIVGPSQGLFTLSDAATITIKANMINDFTGSEPLSTTADVTDQGVFKFLDTDAEPDGVQYRYWEITIDDPTNPSALEIPYIFLGDALRFTHNVAPKFRWETVDTSIRSQSDYGTVFTESRTQYRRFDNLSHLLLDFDNIISIRDVIQEIGLSKPFILALDPTEECFGDSRFTNVLCVFDSVPSFTHAFSNRFTISYGLREVV